MGRRRVRLALKLAACAAAGAVLTVAVAWGVAAKFRSCEHWDYVHQSGVCRWVTAGAVFYTSGGRGPLAGEWMWERDRWARQVLIQRAGPEVVHRIADARGWPALALNMELYASLDGTTHSRWGLSLPVRRAGRGDLGIYFPLVLPLRPMWPGFALDTLFYGTLVFLLWSAPGVVRRRVRKRRGRCPGCGYDLRGTAPGSACPECGASSSTSSTLSSGGPAQPGHSA